MAFFGFADGALSPAAMGMPPLGTTSMGGESLGGASGQPSLLALANGPAHDARSPQSESPAGATPIVPTTIRGALLGKTAPVGFTVFLEGLGANMDTPLSLVACLAHGDVTAALDAVEVAVDGEETTRSLSPIERASVVLIIRTLFIAAGTRAPALGGSEPEVQLVVPPPPGPVHLAAATPTTVTAPDDERWIIMSEIVDQLNKSKARPLSYAEVAVCRARYVEATGDHPVLGTKPSAEQLAALLALLLSGRVPFVDFAVWDAYGQRVARMRRTDAQVWVAGELQTKRIDGPGTYAAWLAAWELFAVAMLSLGHASVDTLNRYNSNS